MTQLTIDVPDDLMARLSDIAEAELRTPESQALWFLREAINNPVKGRQVTAVPDATRLAYFQPVFAELKRLHLQAGKPSCRAVADDIRRRDKGYTVAHSTVNNMLLGVSAPSWPALERVTTALNGDIARMKQLWMTAAAGGSVTE
jgi:hypothetical protein